MPNQERKDLGHLFHPRSIAVVGASSKSSTAWGTFTMQRLVDTAFRGMVTAVGARSRIPIEGTQTVAAWSDLESPPDLAVIAVPSASVAKVVSEAREAGVRAFVVYAAGFAERGPEGAALQTDLVAAAGGMPMLGPNSLGLVSRRVSLTATVSAILDRPGYPAGPVAVVSQSGALGAVLTHMLQRSGLGYSYYVSMGNEATLGLTDVGSYLLDQPEVTVLVLYLESLSDVDGLRRLGWKAKDLGKSVVALTVGRSEAGRRAAISHTAAVVDRSSLVSLICRSAGIAEAHSDTDLVDLALAGTRGISLPESARLAIVTNSGGAGCVLADAAIGAGLAVPEPSAALRAKLLGAGLELASVRNPVDVGPSWLSECTAPLTTLYDHLSASDEFDALVTYLPFGDRFPWVIPTIADITRRSAKPAWMIWSGAPEDAIEEAGYRDLTYESIGDFARALEAIQRGTPPLMKGRLETDPIEAVAGLTLPTAFAGIISEHQAAALLRQAGLTTVTAVASRNVDELLEKIRHSGWDGPFVVKVDAGDFPHRAKHGLVRIGVAHEQLRTTVQEMSTRLSQISKDPQATLLVQPQVHVKREFAIGALRDPGLGTVLTMGPGGKDAETAEDRTLVLLEEGRERVTLIAKEFARSYGLPECEFAAAVLAVGSALATFKDIREVDVNPVALTVDGSLLALDALIVLRSDDATA